jgi:predicted lipoprotein with Yx(FWY)xxD motif
MKRLIALGITIAALTFVAGCGDDGYSGDSGGSSGEPDSSAAASTTQPAGGQAQQSRKRRRTTTLKARNTQFGRILVDGKGRALYLFTREPSTRSRCYGQCAVAWPPFYARGKLRAGSGLDSDKLRSSRRRDGRRIVTYNGHPLYYYVSDTKPGQVTCHNVVEFGGTWLVVNPAGNAVS